jgi:hypothetical protein
VREAPSTPRKSRQRNGISPTVTTVSPVRCSLPDDAAAIAAIVRSSSDHFSNPEQVESDVVRHETWALVEAGEVVAFLHPSTGDQAQRLRFSGWPFVPIGATTESGAN